MKRVYLTSDYDGHKYIIPYEDKEEFGCLLEASYEIEEFYDFEERFGKYATGGDYNNIPLYTDKI